MRVSIEFKARRPRARRVDRLVREGVQLGALAGVVYATWLVNEIAGIAAGSVLAFLWANDFFLGGNNGAGPGAGS